MKSCIATDFEVSREAITKGCDSELLLETKSNAFGKEEYSKLKLMTKEGQSRKPFDRSSFEQLELLKHSNV